MTYKSKTSAFSDYEAIQERLRETYQVDISLPDLAKKFNDIYIQNQPKGSSATLNKLMVTEDDAFKSVQAKAIEEFGRYGIELRTSDIVSSLNTGKPIDNFAAGTKYKNNVKAWVTQKPGDAVPKITWNSFDKDIPEKGSIVYDIKDSPLFAHSNEKGFLTNKAKADLFATQVVNELASTNSYEHKSALAGLKHDTGGTTLVADISDELKESLEQQMKVSNYSEKVSKELSLYEIKLLQDYNRLPEVLDFKKSGEFDYLKNKMPEQSDRLEAIPYTQNWIAQPENYRPLTWLKEEHQPEDTRLKMKDDPMFASEVRTDIAKQNAIRSLQRLKHYNPEHDLVVNFEEQKGILPRARLDGTELDISNTKISKDRVIIPAYQFTIDEQQNITGVEIVGAQDFSDGGKSKFNRVNFGVDKAFHISSGDPTKPIDLMIVSEGVFSGVADQMMVNTKDSNMNFVGISTFSATNMKKVGASIIDQMQGNGPLASVKQAIIICDNDFKAQFDANKNPVLDSNGDFVEALHKKDERDELELSAKEGRGFEPNNCRKAPNVGKEVAIHLMDKLSEPHIYKGMQDASKDELKVAQLPIILAMAGTGKDLKGAETHISSKDVLNASYKKSDTADVLEKYRGWGMTLEQSRESWMNHVSKSSDITKEVIAQKTFRNVKEYHAQNQNLQNTMGELLLGKTGAAAPPNESSNVKMTSKDIEKNIVAAQEKSATLRGRLMWSEDESEVAPKNSTNPEMLQPNTLTCNQSPPKLKV